MRLKIIETLFFVASLVESTSSDLCDDGVTSADEDLPENCRSPETWKSCPQWHCTSKFPIQNQTTDLLYIKPQELDIGGHVCRGDSRENLYPKSGYPNGIPMSGHHTPKWPKYGEYYWVPPLRYVHALEHGAIVFMYHPCTDDQQIRRLRKIASSCLWKHLFFSFKGDLNSTYPMAAVAWGNLVKIPEINDSNSASIKIWIKEHAKVGGNNEGRVFGNGAYSLALVKEAAIVTVEEDSEICPETIDDQAETVKKALEILKNNETPLEEINKMIAEPETPLEVANITDLLENTVSAPTVVTVSPVANYSPALTSKPALEPAQPTIIDLKTVNEDTSVLKQLTENDMNDLEIQSDAQDQTDFLEEGTEGAFSTVNDDFTTTVDPSIPTKESLQDEVKQSGEPLWAFTSLLILVIGLAVAIRRSKLLDRKSPRKAYSVQDSWSDDEGTISVGTLVRGFRRKSKDEQSYSLLQTDDP